MDDADDPVVEQVDVYLSSSVLEKLYVFQYPLRSKATASEQCDPLSVKMKPKQHKVEMEVALDVRSANYCHSKGEHLAQSVDSGADADQQMYSGQLMDKHVYTSSLPPTDPGCYAAGFWHQGALHLCPVSALLQLRPTFTYLDRADRVAARRARELAIENGDSSQDDSAVEEEAKAVTVRFQAAETDEARARRLASFEYITKQAQQEPWMPCQYFSTRSSSTQHVREQIISSRGEESLEFSIGRREYLEKLIPPPAEPVDTPTAGTNGLNKGQLRSLPLKEQVRSLLLSAKLLTYNQLLSLLPGTPEPAQVLKLVQQFAHLVLGCWAVQSEVLYPPKFRSPHSEAPAEALQKGRDYMLWRFTVQRIISRRDIAMVTKLPADDITQMLEEVARLRVNQGWEFLLDEDRDFIAKYPAVVHRQTLLWESRSATLIKHYKLTGPLSPRKDNIGEPIFPRRRRRSSSRGRVSECADEVMTSPRRRRRSSGRERHNSEKRLSMGDAEVLKEVLTAAKHEPMELADTTTGQPATEQPSIRPEEELSAVQRELRPLIRARLQTRHVITRSDVRDLLLVHLASSSVGSALAAGVSDQDLEEAAVAAGAKPLNVSWTKDFTPQPVFVIVPDDRLKPIRDILLTQFERKSICPYGHNWLHKTAQEAGIECSKDECLKVLEEYCEKRGTRSFQIRGTSQDS